MRSTPRAIGALVAVLGLILAVLGLQAAPANAAGGNNGTVKIGDNVIDGQGNEPHIPCEGLITWEGFDDGDQDADILFEVQQPTLNTGPAEADPTLDDSHDFVVSDPRGDLDAQLPFNLTTLLAPFDPHAKNGYHVKVTVTTTASSGSDVKHKVFWVQTCEGEQDEFGGLSINKDVAGNDKPAGTTEFDFTVDCTLGQTAIDLNGEDAGNQASFSLTHGDPAELFTSIPAGASCTITETEDHDADLTTWVVGESSTTGPSKVVTIGSATTVVVVVTNTFDTERCVPTTGNNQCTPCPTGTPTGQGACIPPGCQVNCSPPPPPPSIVTAPNLSATLECAADGLTVTIDNTGDGNGVVDVLRDGRLVVNDVAIPAGDSTEALVPLDEDTAYDIEVTGVESFTGVRDCEPAVVPEVITPPKAPPAPPAAVKGVVVARPAQLPRTGKDVQPLLQVGLGLILLGAGFVFLGKEKTAVI